MRKGSKHSDESRARQSQANLGKTHSAETKEKISAALRTQGTEGAERGERKGRRSVNKPDAALTELLSRRW